MSSLSLKASFVASYPDPEQLPPAKSPEYAFLGRSNVGKSSLINMLCGRKELAHTSGSPGKTRLINLYSVDEGKWYLVDLPGYGYAKRSKKEREEWERTIQDYLLHRESLACLFLLVDANVPPQDKDLERIRWVGENGIPFAILFTKTDKKGKKGSTDRNIQAFKKELQKDWAFLPQSFKTSATKGKGREEILNFIGSVNEEIAKQG